MSLNPQPNLHMPTCSLEAFANSNGVTKEIVKKWASNEIIPTIKFGRYRVVNLAKLFNDLQQA